MNKMIAAYKLWSEFRNHFPKKFRYELADKIDSFFVDIIEAVFVAARLEKKNKSPFLNQANNKLDLLKFFLQICWELKAFDTKKYIALSELLSEIGKMLGGWLLNLQKQTLPK